MSSNPPEVRPFTAVGRWNRNRVPLDPHLLIATPHGLYRLIPKGKSFDDWTVHHHELPELRNAVIRRVAAATFEDEAAVVTILAEGQRGQPVFEMLQESEGSWRAIDPPDPIKPHQLAQFANGALGSGFAALGAGKLRAFYFSLPRAVFSSVFAIGLKPRNEPFFCELQDMPLGIDRLVAPVESVNAARTLCLARLDGQQLFFFPALDLNSREKMNEIAKGRLGIRFDFDDRSLLFDFGAPVGATDASHLTPIVDPGGFCHGMFVRGSQNELYVGAFENGKRPHSTGKATGRPGGPERIVEITCAFFGNGDLHLFARDAGDHVWYAEWQRGALIERIAWESTGMTAKQLAAPSVAGEQPYVFVDGLTEKVDVLVADPSTGWKRIGIRAASEIIGLRAEGQGPREQHAGNEDHAGNDVPHARDPQTSADSLSALGPWPSALPTKLVTSASTIQNAFFPKTVDFEFAPATRPFAVLGRSRPDGKSIDSELFVVTGDGLFHHYVSAGDGLAEWKETIRELPEFKGGVVRRVTATSVGRGEYERTTVAVAGSTSASRPAFVFLQKKRATAGWTRIDEIDSGFHDRIRFAIASGFATIDGEKLHAYYACLRPSDGDQTLHAYGFDHSGNFFRCVLEGVAKEIDRLITPKVTERLSIARLRGNNLSIHAATENPTGDKIQNGILRVAFDPDDRKTTFRLPVAAGEIDASYLLPLNDAAGHCHGMLLRTLHRDADGLRNDLLACQFERDSDGKIRSGRMIALTGTVNAPRDATDATYTIAPDGSLHLFVVDRAASIWHAHCPNGLPLGEIAWRRTGQEGSDVEAPQMIGARPMVFVDGQYESIDSLSDPGAGERWNRTGVAVREPARGGTKMNVHAITISALSADDIPVAGTKVNIRSERPVAVEHEGRLYHLHPDRTQLFRTNALGNVRFAMNGVSVETPALFASSPDLPAFREIRARADDGAFRKLADESFMTGARLKAAKLLPADTSDQAANDFALELRKAAALSRRGEADRAIDSLLATPSHGAMIVRDGDRFRVADASEIAAASMSEGAPPVRLGAADFWSWLQSSWNEVTTIAFNAVNAVVTFVVTVAKKVVEFVTDVARYIAEGIQSIFAALSKLGKDLIDAGRNLVNWLADELGWTDVITCKNAVKAYTTQHLLDFESLVRQVPRTISTGLTWMERNLDAKLEELGRRIGKKAMGPTSAIRDPLRAKMQQHSSATLIVQNAIAGDATTSKVLEPSAALKTKIERLATEVRALIDADTGPNAAELHGALEATVELFRGKTSIEQFLSSVAATLLQTLRRLIRIAFRLADAIQTLIFEIVADAIRAFREVLDKPLSELGSAFAWIDDLYFKISGSKLTILDLGALMFVAPAVILHRLVTGKSFVLPARPDQLVSPFGVVVAALSPAENAITDLIAMAKATAAYIEKVYQWAEAVWSVLRGPISVAENLYAASDFETPPMPDAARRVFEWIVWIVDTILFAWTLLAMLIANADAILDLWMNNEPLRELMRTFGGLALLIAVPTVIYAICAWIGAPGVVKTSILALTSHLAGLLTLVMTIVAIAKYAGTDPAAKEKHLQASMATLFLNVRNFTFVLLPAGCILRKIPKARPLGELCVTTQMTADVCIYTGYGLMSFGRLSMT